MDGILLTATHNALAALVLAVVVWGVTRVVRRPPVAHALWLLVLLRLIAPPVFGVDYAALPAEAPGPATSLESPMPAETGMLRDSRISGMWRWWLQHRGRSSPAAKMGGAERAAVVVETSSVSSAAFDVVADWLPPAWAGFTVILATIVLRRVLMMRRLILQLPPGPGVLQEQAARIAEQLGLRRTPQVRLSTNTAGPFVWSIGPRAVVILPETLVAGLSETQIAMVLTHELAHLRRGDHWVRWVELLAVLACWWNPLLYWARRRLHEAEELCCDAWVAWLYPDQHREYADALLRSAELSGSTGSPAPLLLSPLFRVHPLKARIAMIVHGRTMHRNSRGAVVALAALALVVLPSYLRLTAADADDIDSSVQSGKTIERNEAKEVAADEAQVKAVRSEEYPGRLNITVRVQEEQTKRDGNKEVTVGLLKPVEGATIAAFAGYVDDDGVAVMVNGTTGADGAVSIPVPYGHLQVLPPMLPAGYWVDFTKDNHEQFLTITTSPDAPAYRGAYIARRGSVWNIRAVDADGGAPVGKLQCDVSPMNHHQLNRSGPTVLDAQGVGKFTPPWSSGKFTIRVFGPTGDWESEPRYGNEKLVELTFDDGFDPSRIKAVQAGENPDEYNLLDESGRRTALLKNARAVIESGVLIIEAAVRRIPPNMEVGRAVGMVVDSEGRPVAGAIVHAFLQTGGVGDVTLDLETGARAMTGHRARTDATGRFELDRLSLQTTLGSEDSQLVAQASINGYAPTFSKPAGLPKVAGETVDVGKIVLARGHEVRVRVIDSLGGPAVGAVVYSTAELMPSRRRVTDQKGELIVRDLPAGKVKIGAVYGGEAAIVDVDVPNDDNDKNIVTLRLQSQLQLGVEPRAGGPLAAAQPAPALQIAAWTDGQTRVLDKLREKVVVLYFWNLKEDGCDQELAIIDNLRQRFADDGVVFLGIHRAGSTLDEVRAFMKEKDWRLPTGLDQPGEQGRGLTVEAYGASASSFVVIGADGNIAFNRDAVMDDDNGERLYKQAAQALNINLEEEESEAGTESEKEGCDKCMQILEYIERRAIENALGK